MSELEKLLVPYAVPNITIVSKLNGEEFLLYAVDSDGESVLISNIKRNASKDWFKTCELVTKKMLLEKYRLRK
ncbi:hypothetical protein [Paenibacillus pabuli]|uniref:hypothetical protein n=1 Tax=Paenibacillus pabuli TaxID=1472 RepID=UPI00078347D8|nr:hypothetical protein [Paenibacillus pabuli]MEC0127160.1 hypothetical protein [Paenibacillus pabuli]